MKIRTPLLLSGLLGLAACSSPPPPALEGSLGSAALRAARGTSAQVTLTLTPLNGLTGAVSLSLSGQSQGLSLSPASLSVPGPAAVQQTLTLSVSADAAPGVRTLGLELSQGSAAKSLPFTLEVVPLPLIFSFAPTPAALPASGGRVTLNWVAANASAYVLIVSPAEGVTGLPSGPVSATSAAVTLPANSGSSPAVYTFALFAQGASQTSASATAQVTVGAASARR